MRTSVTQAAAVIAAGVLGAAVSPAAAEDLGVTQAQLYTPYAEWSLTNPSSSGNPFDVIATATFVHDETGETRTTEMFFDGGDTWKFRFAATRSGRWTFSTDSGDADLDGFTGTVEVAPNPDARGFLVAAGEKWAWQIGESGRLEAALPNFVMSYNDPSNFLDPEILDAHLQEFIVEHGFTGIHIPHLGGYLFDIDNGNPVVDVDRHGRNPDPESFRAFETVITATHALGGSVHIWPWGDSAKDWTMDSAPGGENGGIDRRMQRYFAARLGPVAGWTLGYGFDLFEWTTPEEAADWVGFMNDRSGWPHLGGGRSGGPRRDGVFDNSNTNFAAPDALGYAAYEQWEPNYADYTRAFDAVFTGDGDPVVIDKPVFSEDRFRVEGDPDTDPSGKDFVYLQTEPTLWYATLAGGVANIFGNLTDPETGNRVANLDVSFPYPGGFKDEIKTWRTFWLDKRRFRLDTEPMNSLTDFSQEAAEQGIEGPGPAAGNIPGSFAVYSPTSNTAVIYAENTRRIRANLSELASRPGWLFGARVVAVDARDPYEEIDLGAFPLEDTEIRDDRVRPRSDWALAVTPSGPTACDQIDFFEPSGEIDSADQVFMLALLGRGRQDYDADGKIDVFDTIRYLADTDACNTTGNLAPTP